MARSDLPNDGDQAPSKIWGDKIRQGIWTSQDSIDTILARLADAEAKLALIAPTPITSPPVPDFTATTPTSGSVGFSVQFKDLSTNSPTDWLWSFGDGTTSTVPNPSHVYSSAGTFTVSLRVTNAAGAATATKNGFVTVTAASAASTPVASFNASPSSGPAPLSVFFADTSTNTPTAWVWQFGDGTSSNLQNPSHSYTGAGTYTVTLTASNSAGTSALTTQTITATTAVTPTTGLRAAIATTAPSFTTGVSSYTPISTRTTLKTTATTPLPTNAWFENFMVDSGHMPVQFFPYMAKTTTSGLAFCHAPLYYGWANSITCTMLESWTFGTTATVTADTAGQVTGFTDLGCTLRWTATGGTMTADIVRGMGYMTMRYNALTPLLTTIHGITQINGAAPGATLTGTKFKFAMNNGQTWILYASSSISLAYGGTTLTAAAPFTGTLRLAILPTGASETILDQSATAIHTGGNQTVTTAGNTATETFTFTMTGSGSLLTYTLPHHRPRMQNGSYPTGFTLTTLRGQMQAALGNTWTMSVPLPTVGWNAKNPIQTGRLTAIQTALTGDSGFTPHTNDPYFGGKQIAKCAQLALIADQIGNTTVRDTLVGKLETGVNDYLGKLRFETAWSGIVSIAGLSDWRADFGNGIYNDHHFHYGYTIYAAAVLVKLKSAWNTTSNRDKINALVRDIANPSTSDPYFTVMRHWDFYEGHSWASGHKPEAGDNRNSESTSEGVNAYYGIQLWGTAIANTQLTELGRFLMAAEIAAAQTYWQVKSTDTVYAADSAPRRHGVVGIVWSNKVDCQTWFGGQYEYMLGIQEIPQNPTTDPLIRRDWYDEIWPTKVLPLWSRTEVWRAQILAAGSGYVPSKIAADGTRSFDGLNATGGTGTGLRFNANIDTSGGIYEVFIVQPDGRGTGYTDGETVTLVGAGGTGCQVRVYTEPEDGWKALLLGGRALTNPSEALTLANQLTGWDDGSSKTQVLYYIGTQTGA